MSFLARNLKEVVRFLQKMEFWSDIEEMGMPTAARHVNENVDDEVEVITGNPTELHSAEPNPGNATSPSVSDEVQERPVDNHSLEYIECKINKNTISLIRQCMHRFSELLVLSLRKKTECFDWRIPKELEKNGRVRVRTRLFGKLSSWQCALFINHWLWMWYIQEFESSQQESALNETTKVETGREMQPPKSCEPPSVKQEDRLWVPGQLGTDNAETVQYTLWFLATKLLGFSCSHEPRQLQ